MVTEIKLQKLYDMLCDDKPQQVESVSKSSSSSSDSENSIIEIFANDHTCLIVRMCTFIIHISEWLVENSETKKTRRPYLHEFLRLLLDKPQYKDYAAYVIPEQGIFKIYLPHAVAKLWKYVKGRNTKHGMTYDKLARALRYYYKLNIVNPAPGTYTFRFGIKSGFGTEWTPKICSK